jgi:hypothetical protein
MKTAIAFFAGVATGWVLRASFDSFRDLTVSAVSSGLGAAERARRFVAMEREFVEDLVAEGRARFEARRARTAPVAVDATRH